MTRSKSRWRGSGSSRPTRSATRLGMDHNFAASTYGRESVMDYPAPLVTIDDHGDLDFSEAYGVGVGEWDKHAIRWAYSQFPAGRR